MSCVGLLAHPSAYITTLNQAPAVTIGQLSVHTLTKSFTYRPSILCCQQLLWSEQIANLQDRNRSRLEVYD